MTRPTKVIVPAWAELGADMQAETGVRLSPFIPLGHQALYEHIVAYYEKACGSPHITFVMPPHAPDFKTGTLFQSAPDIIRMPRSDSIGQTVAAALRDVGPDTGLVVHMGDTLLSPQSFQPIRDLVFVDVRQDTYRWTTVSRTGQGAVQVIRDRDLTSGGQHQTVCVGVFSFADAALFQHMLKAALQQVTGDVDPFFKAVAEYSKHRGMAFEKPAYWYDCGHVDSYYESQLNFHNLRHFNTLIFDADRGMVTKKSDNKAQFRNQVRWFRQVPDELACFLPRIFKADDGDDPCLTMELLSTPTLSDLFIHRRLDAGAWFDVAKKIKAVQTTFEKYQHPSNLARAICHEVYVKKTTDRIQTFMQQSPDLARLKVATPHGHWSLADVVPSLQDYAEKSGLLNLHELTPIHGDLCFSNIMYDPRGRHIKLIDPRGEFGVPSIYGDPRYDRAKLMHSYAGGYDLIIAGRFALATDASGVLRCDIQFEPYHAIVREIFDGLIHRDAMDRAASLAIQALLLSMLPLHNDRPRRQQAMLYVGLTLYADQLGKPPAT